MLIPISWLKDFVEIKLPLKELMWKMTEAGLTCESYKKIGNDIVLDVEVTANRPDWMSIIGVAREIAAIQNLELKSRKEDVLPKKSENLSIKLIPDFNLFDRWTGIIIKDVKIGQSPKWLADRIKLMGHSPINNIVDTTNYVMYELGIPMHAFDYDEIKGQIMKVQKAVGGEDFTSVDNISYKLPKGAIIIKDSDRIIDLAGIKGGLNSGIKETTKNIFLHVTIDNPVLIRKTSIELGLRSEASAIYERGPDKGGTINSIKRAANLIINLAGGKIASDLIDLKKDKFDPWKVTLSEENMEKILGIKINTKVAVNILSKLNLNPKKVAKGIECTIPTYRGDIKIEEDLIEEVARIYGYNNFPLTLPKGSVLKNKIPYYFDDSIHIKLKQILTAAGYSEVMNLSLISEETIKKFELKTTDHIKITNPVSLEYEYMRKNIAPQLITALKLNTQEKIKLFEIGKVYPSEKYKLGAMSKGYSFREFKGVLDLIFEKLNINNYKVEFETSNPYMHKSIAGTVKSGKTVIGEFGGLSPKVLSNLGLKNEIYILEFDIEELEKIIKTKIFKPIPITPPQIEDITLTFPNKTRVGDVINKIYETSKIVDRVELIDIYNDSYTFRIWYQAEKNLSDKEVEIIREKILRDVKQNFGGMLKE